MEKRDGHMGSEHQKKEGQKSRHCAKESEVRAKIVIARVNAETEELPREILLFTRGKLQTEKCVCVNASAPTCLNLVLSHSSLSPSSSMRQNHWEEHATLHETSPHPRFSGGMFAVSYGVTHCVRDSLANLLSLFTRAPRTITPIQHRFLQHSAVFLRRFITVRLSFESNATSCVCVRACAKACVLLLLMQWHFTVSL